MSVGVPVCKGKEIKKLTHESWLDFSFTSLTLGHKEHGQPKRSAGSICLSLSLSHSSTPSKGKKCLRKRVKERQNSLEHACDEFVLSFSSLNQKSQKIAKGSGLV